MTITNTGKNNILATVFQGVALPASFNAALLTSTTAPTVDTVTMSDVQEVPAGSGYTAGGINVVRSAVGFTAVAIDGTNDWATATLRDLSFAAVGGPLPISGAGIRYLALTDNNAVVANRQIWAFWDLGSTFTFATGGTLDLNEFLLRLTTV